MAAGTRRVLIGAALTIAASMGIASVSGLWALGQDIGALKASASSMDKRLARIENVLVRPYTARAGSVAEVGR